MIALKLKLIGPFQLNQARTNDSYQVDIEKYWKSFSTRGFSPSKIPVNSSVKLGSLSPSHPISCSAMASQSSPYSRCHSQECAQTLTDQIILLNTICSFLKCAVNRIRVHIARLLLHEGVCRIILHQLAVHVLNSDPCTMYIHWCWVLAKKWKSGLCSIALILGNYFEVVIKMY